MESFGEGGEGEAGGGKDEEVGAVAVGECHPLLEEGEGAKVFAGRAHLVNEAVPAEEVGAGLAENESGNSLEERRKGNEGGLGAAKSGRSRGQKEGGSDGNSSNGEGRGEEVEDRGSGVEASERVPDDRERQLGRRRLARRQAGEKVADGSLHVLLHLRRYPQPSRQNTVARPPGVGGEREDGEEGEGRRGRGGEEGVEVGEIERRPGKPVGEEDELDGRGKGKGVSSQVLRVVIVLRTLNNA